MSNNEDSHKTSDNSTEETGPEKADQAQNNSSLNDNKAEKTTAKDDPKVGVTKRIRGALDDRKKLDSKLAELTEALQRERADSMNIRRRHDEEMKTLRNIAKSNVIRDLLPALDSLELALKHAPKDLEGHDYVKGVQGVVKQFEKNLKDIGVEKIKTVGEEFDPRYHEAVSMEGDEGTREVVKEELQPGYTLGDEVIRHAMVKVQLEK